MTSTLPLIPPQPIDRTADQAQAAWKATRDLRRRREAVDMLLATAPEIGIITGAKIADAITALLAAAEARTEHTGAPALLEVFAPIPDTGDGGSQTPAHGLQCPHCGHVTWSGWDDGDLYVVDEAQRWHDAGYDVRQVDERDPANPTRRTGRQVEQRAVVTGYSGDAEFHTLGYRCGPCMLPVALPDDVEELEG